MAGINAEIQYDIDGLDWEVGKDSTWVEKRMFEVFNSLTPEKQLEIKRIFSKLNRLNSLIQWEHARINLLEWMTWSEIQKENLLEKLNGLYRKKNRFIQMLVLKNKWTDKQKEILKNCENLDKLSAKSLLQLEKESSWFLSKTFAFKQTKDENGGIIEEPLDPTNVWEWDIISIDFWKNKSAYWKVWLWDVLNSNIKTAKIKDANGNERVGIRWIQGNKVWYYDVNWYIPIYNGFTIEIPKKAETDSILGKIDKKKLEITDWDENIAKERYINEMDKEDARESKINSLILEKDKKFVENATILAKEIEKSYWIPWQVTLWQAALESWNWRSWLAQSWNYFWIKWKWKTYSTKEYIDWKEKMENDSFRIYGDMKDSFLDYARLLTQKPWYRKAFKYAANINPAPEYFPKDYSPSDYSPEKFLQEIRNAWYATDPRYVEKVVARLKDLNIDVSV